MKNLTALSFFFFILTLPVLLNGQRIANEHTVVSYNRLPDTPLPTEYTTYSASINSPNKDLTQLGLSPGKLINSYLNLRAFKRLNEGGHFHINIEIGALNITKLENKEIETTKEDKEGNKTTTKTYQKIITYQTTSSLQLVDIGGNILIERIINTPDKGGRHIFTKDSRGPSRSDFSSVENLEKEWERRRGVTINEITKAEITKAFKAYSDIISNRIDTRIVRTRVELLLPKGRKVSNAEEFVSITEQAVAILGKMTADEAVTPLRSEIAPVLDFWIAQTEAYDPTGKNTAKVHHACLYNLALTHFYLENFPVAREYIARCQALEIKKGTTSDLAENIDKTTKMMLDKGVNTLHFGFDLSDVQEPVNANYAYLYQGIPPPPAPNAMNKRLEGVPGYIITTMGDSLAGSFIFSDGKQNTPHFYEGGNVTFINLDKDATNERLVDPREIRRASFNGRKFIRMKFADALSPVKRNNLLEILETGPKMTLYYFHPFHTPGEGNLAIQKEEESPLNLSIVNPRFVKWKASFSQLFEDCPALKSAIEAGEYSRSEKNIRSAVQQYNNGACE